MPQRSPRPGAISMGEVCHQSPVTRQLSKPHSAASSPSGMGAAGPLRYRSRVCPTRPVVSALCGLAGHRSMTRRWSMLVRLTMNASLNATFLSAAPAQLLCNIYSWDSLYSDQCPCQVRALPQIREVLEGRRTPSPAHRRLGGRRRWPCRCARGERSARRWPGATSGAGKRERRLMLGLALRPRGLQPQQRGAAARPDEGHCGSAAPSARQSRTQPVRRTGADDSGRKLRATSARGAAWPCLRRRKLERRHHGADPPATAAALRSRVGVRPPLGDGGARVMGPSS